MTKDRLQLVFFILGFFFVIVGSILKIFEIPFSGGFQIIGLALLIAFIVNLLLDLYKDNSLPLNDRIVWGVGILLLPMIIGWFYYIYKKKR